MDAEPQHHWSASGLEMIWSPARRLIQMRFTGLEARGSADNATRFVEQVEHWTSGQACGFLVDCAELADADAGWRSVLNRYFRARENPITVAWYNTSTLIQVMVEMFVLVTPKVRGRVFKGEAEAHAYLREQGFG